jgi:2-oxoglutarate ferredoxin oxidoreductase subunit alpha
MPPVRRVQKADRGWELTGAVNRPRRIITSIGLQPEELESLNMRLQAKQEVIKAREARVETRYTGDADLVVAAFGTAARVAQSAVAEARSQNIRVGLFRPITLWPFPYEQLRTLSQHCSKFLVIEMNAGQMVEDVRLATPGAHVEFFGRMGGFVPTAEEILQQIKAMHASPALAADTGSAQQAVLPAGYVA